MKKISKLFPLLLISLTACGNSIPGTTKYFYIFNSNVTVTLYQGESILFDSIRFQCENLNKASDFYSDDPSCDLYKINHSQEEVKISKDVYNMLYISLDMMEATNGYYNPFIGSLSKLWKESLAKKEVLNKDIIQEELEKIENTHIEIFNKDNEYFAKRTGYANIDLGGIVKGYALEMVKDYLNKAKVNQYLFNAGNSSIVLGEKPEKEGYFTVAIKDIPDAYIDLKNTCLGVSGISEQGVKIDDKVYSHIINPFNGSAINNYDLALVIGENGAICDSLSTAFMMMEINQIQQIEELLNVKSLLYKDNKIVYQNEGIKIKHF